MQRYRQYFYQFTVTYPSGKIVRRYDVVIATKREEVRLIARRAMKREQWLQSARRARVGNLSYGLMLRPTFNARYSAGSLVRLPLSVRPVLRRGVKKAQQNHRRSG